MMKMIRVLSFCSLLVCLFSASASALAADAPRKVVMASMSGDPIYKDIIEWCGKKDPKILIVPTPMEDPPNTLKAFQGALAAYTKNVSVLNLIKPDMKPEAMRALILDSDIIWVCEGYTEYVMGRWDYYYLQESLLLAAKNGTVLCGSSAGGLCWSYAGFNDFTDNRYDLIRGICAERVYFCPHYPGGPWARFDKRLEQETDPSLPDTAFAAGNGSAIFFLNGKAEAHFYTEDAKAYRFDRKDGKWIRTELTAK